MEVGTNEFLKQRGRKQQHLSPGRKQGSALLYAI